MIVFSYSQARRALASLWDLVEETREVALLRRRGHRDLVLLDAEELAALEETARLLGCPDSASRLLAALNKSLRGSGEVTDAEMLAPGGTDRGLYEPTLEGTTESGDVDDAG